jgi:hypothetical protein
MKLKYTFTAIAISMTFSFAQAESYYIKYQGIKLGEIENLSTLKDLYLNAKATNPFVRFLLGKDRYVFYADKKPPIKDAKFRKDKNQLLFALREAITHRPKQKVFNIRGDRKLIVECKDNICQYKYYKHNKFKDSGIIEFDENNNFFKLTEKKSDVVIVRK